MEPTGFAVIPTWLLRSPDFTLHEKAVYAALKSYASKTRTAFPSHLTLATDLGISVSAVQRAMRGLRDGGLVTWDAHRREDGGQTSNRYTIYDAPVTLTTPPVTGTDPPRSERPTPPVTGTDELDPDELDPVGATTSSAKADTSALIKEAFAALWERYPRKQARPRAEKAFKQAVDRAREGGSVEDGAKAIVNGAQRYRDDPNRDQAFTAMPATWLNDDRWNDPPLPARESPRHGSSVSDEPSGPVDVHQWMRR